MLTGRIPSTPLTIFAYIDNIIFKRDVVYYAYNTSSPIFVDFVDYPATTGFRSTSITVNALNLPTSILGTLSSLATPANAAIGLASAFGALIIWILSRSKEKNDQKYSICTAYELAKFAKLKEQGVITQVEFLKKKQDLFEEINMISSHETRRGEGGERKELREIILANWRDRFLAWIVDFILVSIALTVLFAAIAIPIWFFFYYHDMTAAARAYQNVQPIFKKEVYNLQGKHKENCLKFYCLHY